MQGPGNAKKKKKQKKGGVEDVDEESDQETEYDNRGNKMPKNKKQRKPKIGKNG